MRLDGRSAAIGFLAACMLAVCAVGGLFLLAGPQVRSIFHEVALPSGKVIRVTMCTFAWGVEHDDRTPAQDGFLLEYVSSVPHDDPVAVDRETVEVFELIRGVSELWGLDHASVAAFPRVERKGHYYGYQFKRGGDGSWSFTRSAEKVFIDD